MTVMLDNEDGSADCYVSVEFETALYGDLEGFKEKVCVSKENYKVFDGLESMYLFTYYAYRKLNKLFINGELVYTNDLPNEPGKFDYKTVRDSIRSWDF